MLAYTLGYFLALIPIYTPPSSHTPHTYTPRAPCVRLATTRVSLAFPSSEGLGRRYRGRTESSSTGQPHAPRGAHTQRPNAFCNGDLWRETAEGPHDAPWITPPPAPGASLLGPKRGRFSRALSLPTERESERARHGRAESHFSLPFHSRKVGDDRATSSHAKNLTRIETK